jgi:phosphotransferase system enzyme I (PtsI)
MKREYQGYPVVEGVGTGKIKILDCSIPKFEIRKIEDSDRELGRFVRALKTFCENTREEIKMIKENIGLNESGILNSHIKMTHDLALQSELITKISNGMCAEQATCEVCDQYITRFLDADVDFVRQLALDVMDVRLGVLNILLGIESIKVEEFGEDTIVLCEELPPSVVARLDRVHTKGIAVNLGSSNSHCAKLASKMGIPSITGIEDIQSIAKDGEFAIIDGNHGKLVIGD